MRKSTRIVNPMFVITTYFLLLTVLVMTLTSLYPSYVQFMPFGGVDFLSDTDELEVIQSITNLPASRYASALTLAMAMIGVVLVTIPVTWVYFITTRSKRVDRSFAQTIMVLPVVVAGIAMIVQDSLALAFSLAGVTAAVRFRFSLAEPAHALYIFMAIALGLGAGISALGISFVVSVAFVYINLFLWKLDYGADLTTSFFSFLTGRGRDDNEL
jgi:hypothetical protein